MTITRPDAAGAVAAIESPTVCQAFQITAAERPDDVALRTLGGAVSLTWAEYAQKARAMAAGLAALGLKRGDTFACMLVNRPEFHVMDAAAMHLGATSFSIYNTSSPEQIAYLFADAAPRIVVTEMQYLERIRQSGAELEHIVLVDGEAEGAITSDDLAAMGDPAFDFDAAWRAVQADDVLTLIYTSGTTGPPKGVELTHDNQMSVARSLRQVFDPGRGAGVISFLPHAHIADRGVLHYGSQIKGMLGLDKVRISIVGAAPTPPEVMEFFSAIGLTICEVLSMSETTAIATMNPPDRQRFGTVGPPLPGTEVKLDGDGEILVRGPIVMRGYRNLPEKTAEAFTDDGWLRTGDIGQFTDEGYLKIVDRKKELIINAAGKNMSPANIEATLKSASPLIGQAVCIGDARPYNVALIVLDPDVAPAVAAKLGMEGASLEDIARDERANAKLSRVEQIKKFTLLPAEWMPGGDELTPTMKLKRKPIAEKYAQEIEALYAG